MQDHFKSNQLTAIERMLAQHEYGRAFHLAEELRAAYPEDRAVKKLHGEVRRRVHQSDVRMAVSMLAFMLLVVTGFTVFVNGQTERSLALREAQVNALIAEIGELRAADQTLKRNFENSVKATQTKAPRAQLAAPETAAQPASRGETETENVPVIEAVHEPERVAFERRVVRADNAQSHSAFQDGDGFDLLLLGTHDSLTDTIVVASFAEQRRAIVLTSIPRDLVVKGRKVNEYYHYFGVDVLKDYVRQVIGREIDRYAVFDFESFKRAIDAFGGIDVYVEKPLTDYRYPDENGGATLYSVEEGSHHFDGEQALRYARSRKSTSDFDRAARQHQIIKAIFGRLINVAFLENREQTRELYNAVFSGLDTDIGFLEMLDYFERFQTFSIEGGNVLSMANYLYPDRNLGGQYILLPRSGNFDAIREHIDSLIRGGV